MMLLLGGRKVCFVSFFGEEYAAELGGRIGHGGACWLRLEGSLPCLSFRLLLSQSCLSSLCLVPCTN
jgi:hypothetical protein